jgi:hypothetical protein
MSFMAQVTGVDVALTAMAVSAHCRFYPWWRRDRVPHAAVPGS